MNIPIFDEPNQKVNLSDLPTEPPKGLTRQEAEERMADLGEELFALQDLLYGARLHSVLIVLQGRDSAGKDGAIKHVAGCLNPRGVNVVSFGVPTKEESEHDFLWRIHRHAPRKGELAFFNRSHYEDVLVVRVHNLVDKDLWKERYGHINDFEELLSEHGTIVRKFFLNISKKEQEERLLEREQDPRTAWKLNVGDWKERALWKDYTEAYEDAISRCAKKRAPWIVVPADAKWYRNLVIAQTLVEALRPYRKEWQKKLDADGAVAKEALETFRRGQGG